MKKRIVSLFLILAILLSNVAYAKTDYVKTKTGFYARKDLDLDKIFSFDMKDVEDLAEWIFNVKTYVIIDTKENTAGKEFLKGYFNTPNLQHLAKNNLISEIADGYVDDTYDVNETERLVKVGNNVNKVNAITRYGFNIPSYIYNGEYPKINLSIEGIIPDTSLSETLFGWAGKVAHLLLGAKFIKAPDLENFRDLTYLNHTYKDRDEFLLEFFQRNYVKYFVNAIDKSQFSNPKNFLDDFVSDSVKTNAESKISSLTLNNSLYYLTNSKETTYHGKEAGEFANKILSEYHNNDSKFFYKTHEQAYNGDDGYPKSLDYISSYDKYLKEKGSNSDVKAPDVTSYKVILPDEILEPFESVSSDFNQANNDIARYESFLERFNNGSTEKGVIAYNQCLIESDDDKCVSTAYTDTPVTLSVAQVYAMSGLWEVTKDENSTFLTKKQSAQVIRKIKDYSGLYYKQVLSHMVAIIIQNAELVDDTQVLKIPTDIRSMPYDIRSLVPEDREVFRESDPRVDIFNEHFWGGLAGSYTINPEKIMFYIRLQPVLIKLIGRVSELSVFLGQLMNFELLESFGLSPIQLWKSGIISFLIIILTIALLFKLLRFAILSIKGNVSFRKLIRTLVSHTLLLMVLIALMIQPEKVWSMAKTPLVKMMFFAEEKAFVKDDTLDYLYGEDKDIEVTYYLPYLNAWSLYNTGYGLYDSQQYIDTNYLLNEIKDFVSPQLGDKAIKHYSVMLADAFNYYGYSDSIHSITHKDRQVNGNRINKNAYRVVDHFLAPRVTLNQKGDTVHIDVKPNENFNGNFQKSGVSVIVVLLNAINILLVQVVRYLTFLWLGFKIFLFAYELVKGTLLEKKGIIQVLSETLTPVIYIMLWGMYLVILMQLGTPNGTIIGGVMGILFQVFLLWGTRALLTKWSNTSFMPNTIKPLIWVLNPANFMRKFKSDTINNDFIRESKQAGIKIDEDAVCKNDDCMAMTGVLFTENGSDCVYKDAKYKTVYDNWYECIKHKVSLGKTLTQVEERAVKTYKDYYGGM